MAKQVSRYQRRCSQRRRTQARAQFAQSRSCKPAPSALPVPDAEAPPPTPEASGADVGMLAAFMPMLMRAGRRKG